MELIHLKLQHIGDIFNLQNGNIAPNIISLDGVTGV